jgi:hypothetical protein
VRKLKIACVVVAGLSLAAGCEREEKGTTVSPPTGSTPSAAAPTTGPVQTPGQATADAQAVGSAATAGARSAVEQGTAGAADAQTQAAATAELTGEQAKTMLDQAMQYVKQNKYDLAEKTLNQVEAHKTSLPKTLQDQIATVRTALTTAKAGGGLQVPGLGGSPAK